MSLSLKHYKIFLCSFLHKKCFFCEFTSEMFNKMLNKRAKSILLELVCIISLCTCWKILSHPKIKVKRKMKCLLHFQDSMQTSPMCWNKFNTFSHPVKCRRLKLIVRANHLYSPLTRNRKKCDPVTLAAIVFLCGGKENILVCKALLP